MVERDVSREAALLELFLMGKLSRPELEAELARPAEPEGNFVPIAYSFAAAEQGA